LSILMLCFYMTMGTNEEAVILSIISTLLMIAISQIIIKNKDNKSNIIAEDSKKIPIGTYLCISNIAFLILQNFILGVNI
jgi:3D (Asp-Asp-Asp) domain-containing protein